MEYLQPRISSFSSDSGDAVLTEYEVFPGVKLIYHSVQMDRLELRMVTQGDVIEIHHCREGVVEQCAGEELFCLMPGDLSVTIRSETMRAFTNSLRHYEGLALVIDAGLARQAFASALDGVTIDPLQTARRLCGQGYTCTIRAEKDLEAIFSPLYPAPEQVRPGDLRLKVLGALAMLDGFEPQAGRPEETALSSYQVQLARQAADYLCSHLDRHVTIPELAKRFSVSNTHLKAAFKGVYGMPVFSYMRVQKMQAAGRMLAHTGRPVADIAAEVGYSNSSKFSAAFREVMGRTPSEYRAEYADE